MPARGLFRFGAVPALDGADDLLMLEHGRFGPAPYGKCRARKQSQRVVQLVECPDKVAIVRRFVDRVMKLIIDLCQPADVSHRILEHSAQMAEGCDFGGRGMERGKS